MAKLYLVVKNTGRGAFIWGLFKDPKKTEDLDPLMYRTIELQSDLVEEEESSSMEQVRAEDRPTA